MRYQIIEDIDRNSFEIKVERFLADSWKLQGGIYLGRNEYGSTVYIQAMTTNNNSYPAAGRRD